MFAFEIIIFKRVELVITKGKDIKCTLLHLIALFFPIFHL